MSFRAPQFFCVAPVLVVCSAICLQVASSPQTSSSSSSNSRGHSPTHPAQPALDEGSVSAGVYGNPSFAFACKIPAGWVLRTEEMNVQDSENDKVEADRTAVDAGKGRKVLLAAFSRPPQARSEDVNASILIAAERASAYPGLKEAAQYFGPVTEVARAQGFEVDGEPYESVIGTKTLVRDDFHKDVGSRVMRQSTLVMLARGYAVSFTFIGGTEDEVEELVQGLSVGRAGKAVK